MAKPEEKSARGQELAAAVVSWRQTPPEADSAEGDEA